MHFLHIFLTFLAIFTWINTTLRAVLYSQFEKNKTPNAGMAYFIMFWINLAAMSLAIYSWHIGGC